MDEKVLACGIVLEEHDKRVQEAYWAQATAEASLEALVNEHAMALKRAKWAEEDSSERTKKLRNNINSLNKRISKHAEEITAKEYETQ